MLGRKEEERPSVRVMRGKKGDLDKRVRVEQSDDMEHWNMDARLNRGGLELTLQIVFRIN